MTDPTARPLLARISRVHGALALVVGVVVAVVIIGGMLASRAGTARVSSSGGATRVAVEHPCPVRSLPRAVEVQLGVCG